MDDCELCSLQRRTESGDDPWAVARRQPGYVGLNPLQYYRGYPFFSSSVEEQDTGVRERLVADLLTELRSADVVIESTFR